MAKYNVGVRVQLSTNYEKIDADSEEHAKEIAKLLLIDDIYIVGNERRVEDMSAYSCVKVEDEG